MTKQLIDLLVINGVHYIFIGVLVLGTSALMIVISWAFFKDLIKARKNNGKDDDNDTGALSF